jgi:glycosyltransferase involved in cell wall biosynthesis
MTTILHVPTVGWSPREGVSRVVAELVGATPWHDHHLLAAVRHELAETQFTTVTTTPGWMGSITFRRDFAAVLRELRPDVVHLHGGALVPALAAAPALRGTPVVASIYGPFVPLGHRHGGLRSAVHATGAHVAPVQSLLSSALGAGVGRWALRTGRVLAVCTPDPLVAAALTAAGPVINAQGAATVGPVCAQWSDRPVIGFAGRAERGRGIEDLVAAFDLIRAEVPGARLRLLLLPNGEGTRWLTRIQGRPDVEVRVGEAACLDQELAECHVVALPFRRSMTITPPLVAAETMAVGVPVVATSVPCMASLVEDGVTGRVVPPHDPTALAEAICWTIADRSRWEEMSAAARYTIATHWSWPAAASAVDDAYALATGRTPLHAV